MTKRQKKLLTRIIIAAVIYIAGIFLPLEGIPQLTRYLFGYSMESHYKYYTWTDF